MASSSKQIPPALYREYGQTPNQPQQEVSGDFLFDHSFDSRCPPVVTTDTTIIAVCGANDINNNAAPDADGFFFSDFYLFHHLFRGTAKNQYWMTCVKPQDLIKKYKEFVHGDPRSHDRRVVLDETFAEDVRDVLVFPPEDLLERFLSYVASSCRSVVDGTVFQKPLLVLIFGHGRRHTFSITIGGAGQVDESSQLVLRNLKEAIYRHNANPNVALVTTNCYGGGWTQTGISKFTGISEVTKDEISLSASNSIGRFCGSRYARGVTRALIRSEIETLDLDTEEEMQQTPMYAALVRSIRDILKKEVDEKETNNDISFSAKDDLWGAEWRARTGFPLAYYREKWNSLRSVYYDGSSSDQILTATVKFTDSVRLSVPAAEFRLKRMALDYMTSLPGDDSAPKNHSVHSHSRKLLKGVTLTAEELERLAGSLNYRLKKVIARATEYKNRLGISFPDCHETDVDALRIELSKRNRKHNDKNQNQDQDIDTSEIRTYDIQRQIYTLHLFDKPGQGEGHEYVTGETYLAIVLTTQTENGWRSRAEIEEALNELVKFNEDTNPLIRTMRALGFADVPEIHGMVGSLARSFDKRLLKQTRIGN